MLGPVICTFFTGPNVHSTSIYLGKHWINILLANDTTTIWHLSKMTSQFHRKYYFRQEEEEMKLCLMILSVPWYMFNGLEHTAILSHFLTFITGSSSRLLCIRISAAVTLYWFPVRHFWCKEFNPLVIWIWNKNMLFLP
jgi:hypothetical protein